MGNESRGPRGLYERLLAEKRTLGETGRYNSGVLRELEETAPSNSPEYIADLVTLYRLIESGGPGNCASSMWFSYLAYRYPDEYDRLKAEHLGKGGRLQEGLRHTRSFSREELEHLDVVEDLVFCTKQGDEYGLFTHEADVLLMALGSQLETGQMTLEEAIEYWRPYRQWCEQLYYPPEPGDDEFMLLTSGGIFAPMPEAIDFFVEASQYLPASGRFHVHADDLGVRGAEVSGPPPRNVFGVTSKKALNRLAAACSGNYKIILKEDISDYDFTASGSSPEEAIKLFERTLLDSHEGR
jgi:hypothetical protein